MKLVGYQYFTNKQTGKRSLMLYLTRPIKSEDGYGECFVTSGSRENPIIGKFAKPACIIPKDAIGAEVQFVYEVDDYGNPQISRIVKG